MRVAGAGLLALCCVFAGLCRAQEFAAQAKTAQLCLRFWREFAAFLSYTRETPREILLRLSGEQAYRELAFLHTAVQCPGTFCGAVQQAAQQHRRELGACLGLMQELAAVPGASNLENQLEQMDILCGRLEAKAQELEQQAKQQGRLYRSVSLYGGALVFLLLL